MERKNRFYNICRHIFNFCFKKCCNVKIIDKENIPKEGNIILAGNHRAFFDPCLTFISTDRQIHYLVKKECVNNRFLGWAFKKLGCISIDRENADIHGIKTAIRILKKGGAIGIFPEGTRNKTDNGLLTFKRGAVTLAQKTNAYIVPFGTTGDYRLRSNNLKIRYGKPFKVDNMSLQEANERLKKEIEELIKQNLNEEERGE